MRGKNLNYTSNFKTGHNYKIVDSALMKDLC